MRTARIDWAALLLRLAVGGLMLFHGYSKISQGLDKGLVKVKEALVASNMPDWMAWGVYAGEILAPIGLILGILVPLAGLGIAATMGFAIYLSHQADLTAINAHGGYAIELQLLFLVGGLCCSLLGAGRFSVLGLKSDGPIAS